MRWFKQIIFCLALLLCDEMAFCQNFRYFTDKVLEQDDDLIKMIDEHYRSPDNIPTLTNQGTTSSSPYCRFHPMSIVTLHTLIRNHHQLLSHTPIAIDIGSAYGGCTRVLGLLGYNVFAIDKLPYSKYYKKLFCSTDFPANSLFYIFLTKYNFANNADERNKICNMVKQKVQFVPGEFPNSEIINKLPTSWDMVLALDVLPFMDNKDAKPSNMIRSLAIIKNKLSKDGTVMIAYPQNNTNIGILRYYLSQHFQIVHEFSSRGDADNTVLFLAMRKKLP